MSGVFNISAVKGELRVRPRNASEAKTLSPDYIIYFLKHQRRTCIPTLDYWQLHRIQQSEQTRIVTINSTRETAETKVISTLSGIIEKARKQKRRFPAKEDLIVALVYCDAFPTEMSLPLMHENFRRIRSSLQPVRELENIALEAMTKTGLPLNGDYIAVHLRLLDHCKSSLSECCCTTSGSSTKLDEGILDKLLASVTRNYGQKKIFIAAPPSFKDMVVKWNFTEKETLVTWYSDESPGSLSESMVQQIICKKASLFLYSVAQSTWSQSVVAWQENGISRHVHEATLLPDLQEMSQYIPPHAHLYRSKALSQSVLNANEQWLEHNLKPRVCDVKDTVFVMLRNDGFGASLHFILLAFGFAVKHNYTLVPLPVRADTTWIWSKHCSVGDDPQRSWGCLFQSVHNCTGFVWEDNKYSFDEFSSKVQVSWQKKNPCIAPLCFSFARASNNFDFKLHEVSFGIKNPAENSVIHRGHLLSKLLSPSEELRAALTDGRITKHAFIEGGSETVNITLTMSQFIDYISSLRKENSVLLGLHIRRGDACNDPRRIRKCFAVSDYISAILDMKMAYNITAIYLATDEASVVEELNKALAGTYIFTQQVRREMFYSGNHTTYNLENIPAKMGKLEPESSSAMTFSALFDWLALRESDAFIGTFTSDFGRIAFELISSRMNSVPPYVSLEETYCKPRKPRNGFQISGRVVYTCY